ncbi:MAG: hypothetical protein HOW71_10310 [Nonomuraea sp.]|nr:hypothetical protein [Nonomuraea sp.]
MRRLLVVLSLALAACGAAPPKDDGVVSAGGGGSARPSASPTATMSEQEAGVKFAQCMREHGIPMDDPKEGRIMIRMPKDMDPAKAEKAQKECQPIMDAVVRKGDGTMDPERFDRMVKFAQCMRKHGVDMPDPKPGEGLQLKIGPGRKDKLETAQKACEQYAPGGPE